MRVAIAAVIAAAALPAIGASGLPAAALEEPWRLLPAAVVEFALGSVIGVLAMLPVAAFRTAGALAGMQAGLGFGQLYDASTGEEDGGDALEQLLALLGAACFVWAGGLDAVALSALRSAESAISSLESDRDNIRSKIDANELGLVGSQTDAERQRHRDELNRLRGERHRIEDRLREAEYERRDRNYDVSRLRGELGFRYGAW
jgi:hypothetical protein